MDIATPRDLRGRFASDQGAVVKAQNGIGGQMVTDECQCWS